MLENGTTGAAQESISQSSVSAVEPRIIDSNSGFSYLDKAQRKRLWGEQTDVLALLRAMLSNGRERLSARLFFA